MQGNSYAKLQNLAVKQGVYALLTYGNIRVVTWYMGSGLKAQNLTGIRAQRKGLRAQKNGIRDHKAFEPESGIRFITRSKNILSQYIVFPRNKVCVQ